MDSAFTGPAGRRGTGYDLQRHTTTRQLIESLQSNTPRYTEGRDPTGSIRVVVDSDGRLMEIHAQPDWQHHLHPSVVGSAVVQASTAASHQATRALLQAMAQTRLPASDRLQQNASSPADTLPDATREPTAPPVPTPESPRDLMVVADDMLRVVKELDQDADGPMVGVGTAAAGKVSVTLTPGGITRCVIDSSWARLQSGTGLTAALEAALIDARVALQRRVQPPELDGLFAEVLAAIKELQDETRTWQGGTR